MQTNTIDGTYGTSKTPCDVFTAEDNNGYTHYAVEGSCNVNLVRGELSDGVDVEALEDIDFFTWPEGVNSEEELVKAIEA